MPAPAVIDYASPVPRSKLRLPARSEIRWVDAPGRLVVTQVLAGREGAVWALGLAGFTFGLMSLALVGMIERWHRNVAPIAMIVMVMAAEVLVSVLVIRNTWRKTILTVTREELAVETAGPLASRQRFVFPTEQVAGVVVVDREPQPGEARVAELEIRFWSIPSVHLFAGHPPETLRAIVSSIAHVQPVAPPPLPAALATARATTPVRPQANTDLQ